MFISFEVSLLGGGLMGASLTGPCNDAGWIDAALCQAVCKASDFLGRPADQERRHVIGEVFLGEAWRWRYLAQSGSRALASSEVSAGADGRPTGLAQVNMGPYVQSTMQVLADLSENAEFQVGSCELHMLKIPALCTVVLWLSPPNADNNLFVPLAPAPDYLEAGRIYHEDEMLDAR